MSDGPNRLVRLVVPLVVLVGGLLLVGPMFFTGGGQPPGGGGPAQQSSGAGGPDGEAGASGEGAGGEGVGGSQEEGASGDVEEEGAGEGGEGGGPAGEGDAAASGAGEPAPRGLRAREFAGVGRAEAIGSLDPSSGHELHVEFASRGAGISRLSLTGHWQSIAKQAHAVVQSERTDPLTGARFVPFAALHVRVGDQVVRLSTANEKRVWRPLEGTPGGFEAFVEDGSGAGVLRLTRVFEVEEGSYDLVLRQRVENLTARRLEVELSTLGPIDLPPDDLGYGGDLRRVRFGYLADPNLDPARQVVLGQKFQTQSRTAGRVLGPASEGRYEFARQLWPSEETVRANLELVWLGVTNRYFGVAMHPLVDASEATPDKVFRNVERVDRLLSNRDRSAVKSGDEEVQASIVLRTHSGSRVVGAGGALDLDAGIYAGPLSRSVIGSEPRAEAAGLRTLVVYAYGSCAFCTFSWLTGLLLELLHVFGNNVFHDWSLAIIFLVLVVRTILHPITRWSQIRMQRFGKQMQELAPKMKKIQEKYKDDRKRMQEETARLYREEGINPAGMLGCLPMFLQTPVWIALYAVLMFDFDLRHESAFFGMFQAIFPQHWHFMGSFLGDLAQPDRFYFFGRTLFSIPFMGDIKSFNILPLLLAVVFYAHQKYLTPQTSASLSPEQEQQQKIMKIMMVVMFPVIMYNAPSGLALYFIVNSGLGIFESRHIRKHAEAKGLLEPKKPGERKRGGFMQRMMELAEQQRQMQARSGRSGGRPGAGKRKR